MKKMLLVLCVVMVASLIASAQLVNPSTYNRTAVGYCDGWHMVLQKLSASGTGSSKVYIGGYDDLVDACGFSYNSPIVGQKHATGFTVPPHNLVGIGGPVFDLSDALQDAVSNYYTGIQLEFLVDIRDSFFAGFFGDTADGDYWYIEGSLSNGLPAKGNGATKALPTVAGTFKKPAK